ncbi:MAG: dienelactone hydrolase family protein [Anaerolineae bacterium]|nr:dienelactone hydrolase family protein [Anaerolineae bacterium]
MNGPHQGQPILTTGAALEQASAAMILVHGRGADAGSILELAGEFDRPELAYLAPQAAGSTWYPNRFIAPLESNEPYLTSALQAVGDLLAHVEQAGIPAEKTVLLGFSQGACLALEFAARNARRFGGVVALSGGLIGPPGTAFEYPGSLEGTPVFLGCSDVDFHIPVARVHESTAAMRKLGGDVTERIYPNMGHTVNQDEIDFVRDLLAKLT